MKANIRYPKNISLDDVCTLISQVTTGKDSLGQPIIEEKPFMIFCSKLSITRAEYATAGQLGFKPDMLLIVDSDSYDEEKYVDYYGKKFTIYKSFMRSDNFTEIYCEVDANDRN